MRCDRDLIPVRSLSSIFGKVVFFTEGFLFSLGELGEISLPAWTEIDVPTPKTTNKWLRVFLKFCTHWAIFTKIILCHSFSICLTKTKIVRKVCSAKYWTKKNNHTQGRVVVSIGAFFDCDFCEIRKNGYLCAIELEQSHSSEWLINP